jgi:hypothetical protein
VEEVEEEEDEEEAAVKEAVLIETIEVVRVALLIVLQEIQNLAS